MCSEERSSVIVDEFGADEFGAIISLKAANRQAKLGTSISNKVNNMSMNI